MDFSLLIVGFDVKENTSIVHNNVQDFGSKLITDDETLKSGLNGEVLDTVSTNSLVLLVGEGL